VAPKIRKNKHASDHTGPKPTRLAAKNAILWLENGNFWILKLPQMAPRSITYATDIFVWWQSPVLTGIGPTLTDKQL